MRRRDAAFMGLEARGGGRSRSPPRRSNVPRQMEVGDVITGTGNGGNVSALIGGR